MNGIESGRVGRREFLLGSAAGAAALALPGRATAAESARPLKVGVVGSGHRARGSHLPMLRHYLPQTRVVALCDITPENLRQGLAICGPETAGYSDHREMLARHPELEAVVVVIPNYKHADIAVDALHAGKHVLSEKPMATHLADAGRMMEAAKQKNLVLQIGHQMRYARRFHQAADLIRQGRIGTVEYVYAAIFRGDWNPNSWKYTDPVTGVKTNWRYLTLTEGSALLEDGIHELDVIHWLVGAEPRRIQAIGGNNVYRDRQTIDHAGLLIEFSNSVKCEFAFTIFTPRVRRARPMRIFGSEAEMSIDGGTITIEPYRKPPETIPVALLSASEEAMLKPMFKEAGAEKKFDADTWREHVAFQQSVRTGDPPFCSGSVGRDAAHISLAAEHSLRTGSPVEWQETDL